MDRLRQALAIENPALEYVLVAICGLLAWNIVRADLYWLWRIARLVFVG